MNNGTPYAGPDVGTCIGGNGDSPVCCIGNIAEGRGSRGLERRDPRCSLRAEHFSTAGGGWRGGKEGTKCYFETILAENKLGSISSHAQGQGGRGNLVVAGAR